MVPEWRGPYREVRDIWLGIYWDHVRTWDAWKRKHEHELKVYVCVVPCFPVRLTWRWHR